MGSRCKRFGCRAAFTLVEMLVVIFIVGVLISLLVVVIPKVRMTVAGTQTQAQMAAVGTAIQAYYSDFRAYPGPLPNSQVGCLYYPAANYKTAPQSSYVYVIDPVTAAVKALELATGPLSSESFQTFTQIQQVTGAENLFLGLIGGLELTYDAKTTAVTHFAYSDASIFPDARTPTPLGPLVLNPTTPKRFGGYLQVKQGDLSNSRTAGTPTNYADAGGRQATDSPIPEFMDKFGTPMPILYLRANAGGTAVAAIGGQTKYASGSLVSQTNPDASTTVITAQYDLAQVAGYTRGSMGAAINTVVNDPKRDHHGLQDLGTFADPIEGSLATKTGFFNAGMNGLAYLKDPSNPGTVNAPDYSTSPPKIGNARQKDAFLLISAGPDGIYGTSDDITYPGGVISSQ